MYDPRVRRSAETPRTRRSVYKLGQYCHLHCASSSSLSSSSLHSGCVRASSTAIVAQQPHLEAMSFSAVLTLVLALLGFAAVSASEDARLSNC